jgi:hypothetical protein
MKVKPYIILNTARKHVKYEEVKNKVPMNKPYNIQNTNICNGIFHISFFKALLINEGETTRIQGGLTPTAFKLVLSAGKLNLPLVPSQDYVLQDNKRS